MSEMTIQDSSTVQSQSDQQDSGRVFYRSDYRRMAQVLRSMRHVRGDRYTGKPQAAQDEVAALALTIGQAFEADAASACAGCGFDFGKFIAGTQLPEKPVYGSAGNLSANTLYEDGPDPDGFDGDDDGTDDEPDE